MDIMKIINQAKEIILNPKEALKKYKDTKVTQQDLIIYLAIVAFPMLIGIFLGYAVVGYGYYGSLIGPALGRAIVQYILSIIGVIVFGMVLNMLAPSFGLKENKMQAMKLVAYAATPWLLAGIFWIFPVIGIISLLAGLYGLYILYIGLPIYMDTPKDKQFPYFIIGIIVYIIIMAIIWWIADAIWWSMAGVGPGYTYPNYWR